MRCRPIVGSWILVGLLLACGGGAAMAQEAEVVETKVVKMDAENWAWVPDSVTVTLGTKVVLKIKGFDAPHRFDLKAYGLKVAVPQDETTTIEFVADKPGTFKWKCGRPCGNGCPKMTGKLTVLVPAAEEP